MPQVVIWNGHVWIGEQELQQPIDGVQDCLAIPPAHIRVPLNTALYNIEPRRHPGLRPYLGDEVAYKTEVRREVARVELRDIPTRR